MVGWKLNCKTYLYLRVHLECFHARNHSKLGLRCYSDGWLEAKVQKNIPIPQSPLGVLSCEKPLQIRSKVLL